MSDLENIIETEVELCIERIKEAERRCRELKSGTFFHHHDVCDERCIKYGDELHYDCNICLETQTDES